MRKNLILLAILFLLISCNKVNKLDKKENNQSKKPEINSCILKMFEGEIEIFDDKFNRLNVEVGMKLSPNWSIKTQEDSLAELGIGKEETQTVIIKENSNIVINKLFKNNNQENTGFIIKNGVIFTSSKKLTQGSSFEVETKSITVGIRGTDFSVSDVDGESKVFVENGEVKVKKNIVSDEELQEIKEKDEKLYKELKESINEEIEVKENEKLEITEKELEEESKEIKGSLENIKKRLRNSEKISSDDNDIKRIKNRKRIFKKNRINKEDREKYLNRKSEKIRRDNIKREILKNKEKRKDKIKEKINKSESDESYHFSDGRILLKTIQFSDPLLIESISVNNEKFSKIVFETEENDIVFKRVRIVYSDKKDTVFSKNFSISKGANKDGILAVDSSKEIVKINVTLTSKMNNSPTTKIFVYGIR
ncbi:MAG TPA: FecR domain-containing protein [Spirochaetota bacterium]|nr:FecR domain-containing protein [Spirochaetota bacterium]HOL56957.1 FecR domain-containing protein [Spirochaetota bacterium]HPP04532.1 FecR domain-containing protein [Spirochaetota bacterium]